jgi:Protein of unknown function (DUF2281)
MTSKEQLLKAIEQVPDPLIEEILDFLLFIQSRRCPNLPEPSTQPSAKRQWSPHFFERTAGAWQGEPLVREDQGEQAERDAFL